MCECTDTGDDPTEQGRLFAHHYDTIRASLIVEILNPVARVNATLTVWGGEAGVVLHREAWQSVAAGDVDVLASDLAAALCTLLDTHVGPFD